MPTVCEWVKSLTTRRLASNGRYVCRCGGGARVTGGGLFGEATERENVRLEGGHSFKVASTTALDTRDMSVLMRMNEWYTCRVGEWVAAMVLREAADGCARRAVVKRR